MFRRLVIAAAWVSAAVFIAAALRSLDVYNIDFDASFPHPDAVLIAAEQWLNERNPPKPGEIKLHGEWPRLTTYCFLAGAAFVLTALVVAVIRKPRSAVRIATEND